MGQRNTSSLWVGDAPLTVEVAYGQAHDGGRQGRGVAAVRQRRRAAMIGRAMGSSPVSVAEFIRNAGGIRPSRGARRQTAGGDGRRELTRYLRSGRGVRRPKGHRGLNGKGGGKITNVVHISERPAEAEDRAVPGHWEGDLLFGKGMYRSGRWSSGRPGSCC
jgi:hypothetical protein